MAPSLDILGGQAVQAQRLFKGLQESTAVSVRFLAVNPRLPGMLGWLQRIKYVRTVLTSVAYVVNLLIQVPRSDVVHAFSASYYSFLLAPTPALLVARLFGRPAILNYRSGEASDHLTHWSFSRRLIARLPTAVVVPSEYLVAVFGQHGVAAHAIPNFVPIERLSFRVREPLAPRFLSNRNLEALYNVECILRSFQLIQRERTDATLTVVGDGAQRSRLESLCKELGLRDVKFVGRVPSERMPDFYAQCDIYLNSPNIDNMPTSIIEAFASGLPVVTTEAGGIPYIVEHGRTGLMVKMNDYEALARAALSLLRDPQQARSIAQAARAECEQRYVWPRVRADWERCYEALAGGVSL
ncbi:MAG: glycosyltransferase family 4 protein [Proteobacteria bacterium]|nr:glycosyltransferase family 4 protein [Pseudomonadota bacterium]